MLVTCHWSATGPTRLNDYHIEFALAGAPPILSLGVPPTVEQWAALRGAFKIWKHDDLGQPTDYGTWHLNHDPRDRSSNIEIGALCMANATTQAWGNHPFTAPHVWMMAGIVARVCLLKAIDAGDCFAVAVAPGVLQNGPIYVVSTHAERALQTQNPGVDHPELPRLRPQICRMPLTPKRPLPRARSGFEIPRRPSRQLEWPIFGDWTPSPRAPVRDHASHRVRRRVCRL
jgi:hypothetical protein